MVLLIEELIETQEEGLQGLGFLAGHKRSAATSVSADGEVIAGDSGELFDFPFRWTEAGGMEPLDAGPTYRDVIVSGDGKRLPGRAQQVDTSKPRFGPQAKGSVGWTTC